MDEHCNHYFKIINTEISILNQIINEIKVVYNRELLNDNNLKKCSQYKKQIDVFEEELNKLKADREFYSRSPNREETTSYLIARHSFWD